MRSNYKSPYYILLIAFGFRLRDSGFYFTTVYRARRAHISSRKAHISTVYQILLTSGFWLRASFYSCYLLLATCYYSKFYAKI